MRITSRSKADGGENYSEVLVWYVTDKTVQTNVINTKYDNCQIASSPSSWSGGGENGSSLFGKLLMNTKWYKRVATVILGVQRPFPFFTLHVESWKDLMTFARSVSINGYCRNMISHA